MPEPKLKQVEVSDQLAEVWNEWTKIPSSEKSQNDNADFRFHVDALHNILFAGAYKKQNEPKF